MSIKTKAKLLGASIIALILIMYGTAAFAQGNFVLTATADPVNIVADGVSTSTITATVRNQGGNPVGGRLVNFNIISPDLGCTLIPLSASSNAEGNAISVLTAGLTAGQVTIQAQTGDVTTTATITLTTTPDIDDVIMTAEPVNVAANGVNTSTITALVLDQNGDPIGGQEVVFGIVNDALGSTLLSPLTATTNAAGEAHNILQAGTTDGQVTVQAQADTITASVTITLYNPQVDTVTLNATPASVVANGVTTSSITALVRDQFGAPMGDETVTFSFDGDDLGCTLIPQSDTTDNDGRAQSVMTAGSTPGQVHIQGQIGTITDAVTVTLGIASDISVTAAPNDIAANGVTTSSITALVRDQFGNPLAGQTVNFGFVGDKLDTELLLPLTATSNAAGEAHNILKAGIITGQVLVRAQADAISDTTTITLTTPTPDFIEVWAAPSSLTADGFSTSIIAALVRDQSGVPMENETISFSFIDGLDTNLAPPTDSSNGEGIAYSTLTAGTTAGQAIIQAQVGTVTNTAGVTLTAPTITVTATPDSIVADGMAASNIIAEVYDSSGAPLGNQEVNFSLLGDPLGCTLEPQSDATGGNGRAQSILTAGTTPGQVTIQAQTGVVTSTAVVTLTGSGISLTVTANPTSIVADGTATSNIIAEVRDPSGAPLGNQEVNFSLLGDPLGCTLEPQSDATGGNGRVQSILTADITPGQVTIQAQTGAVTSTVVVTLTESTISLTLTANPTSIIADGISTADIIAEVHDPSGAPLGGQAVNFSFIGDPLSSTLVPQSDTTDGNGHAQSLLTAGSIPGQVIIQAQTGAVTATTTVTLTEIPTVTEVIASANPANIIANGINTSTITAIILDQYGNPMLGQEVTFGFEGANWGSQLTPLSDTSGVNGLAESVLTAGTTTGQLNIVVQVGAITRTIMVNLYSPEVTAVTVDAVPLIVVADGTSTSTIAATVLDQFNRTMSNEMVNFNFIGDNLNSTLTPAAASSNNEGIATSTLTAGMITGTVTVQAESNTVTGTVTVTLTELYTPTVTNLVVTANPDSILANGSDTSDITVSVQDQFGSPMMGENVAVSIIAPDLGCQLTPLSGNTNLAGEFVSTLTAGTTIGQITVLAQSGTITDTITVTLSDPSAPVVERVTVIADPVNIMANGTSTATITAWVHDPLGLPLANQTVEFYFSGNDLGSSLNPVTSTTGTNGSTYSILTAATTAGQVTIRARSGSVVGNEAMISLIEVPGSCTEVTDVTIAGPNTVEIGTRATFTATPSVDATEPITYTWYWGDGSAPEVTTTSTASHVYNIANTYNVTVTAMNCAMDTPVSSPVWNVQVEQTSWQIFMPVVLKNYSG